MGPGNTPGSSATILDKSGEIILEANLEYRFTVIKKFLESALFFDAGNIWNLNKEGVANSIYGILKPETFISEIALNTGVGFRFDLSIFMFRLDWGIPLRDPSKYADKYVDKRWVLAENFKNNNLSPFLLHQTAIAIGIGYPF